MERREGFTLVEIFITMLVIAVLAGIVLIMAGRSEEKAKSGACYVNRKSIIVAYDLYKYSHSLTDSSYPLSQFITDKYQNNISNNESTCPSGGIYSAGTLNSKDIVVCSIHGGEEESGSETPGGETGGGTGNYITWTNSFGNPGILPNSTWPTPVYSGSMITNQVALPTGSSFAYVNESGVTEFYIVTAWAGSITFGRTNSASSTTPDGAAWGSTEIIKISTREVTKWSEVTSSTPIFTLGDVVYDDTSGKYYIARGTGNIWNAPASGNWVEIK